MTTAQQQVTNLDAAGVSQISTISEISPPSVSGVDTRDNAEGTSCLPDDLKPHTHGRSSSAADRPPQAGASTATSKPTSSVFSRSESAPVHNVPMRVIHRPLPSELDESKVEAFMREMQAGDAFTPIELAKVKAPLRSDPTGQPQVFYFAMGGCHRYEATKRLGWETIRARIIDVPASQMRVYLGAGSPF